MNRCKYCASEDLHTEEKPPHIGLYCGNCGKFQKWVKQEQNIDTGEAATPAQQRYAISLLRQWKTKGVPMTARQAGNIISAFRE